MVASKRYTIRVLIQSTNSIRTKASDENSYTGDVIEEYWCDVKIRDHKYTFAKTVFVQPDPIHSIGHQKGDRSQMKKTPTLNSHEKALPPQKEVVVSVG